MMKDFVHIIGLKKKIKFILILVNFNIESAMIIDRGWGYRFTRGCCELEESIMKAPEVGVEPMGTVALIAWRANRLHNLTIPKKCGLVHAVVSHKFMFHSNTDFGSDLYMIFREFRESAILVFRGESLIGKTSFTIFATFLVMYWWSLLIWPYKRSYIENRYMWYWRLRFSHLIGVLGISSRHQTLDDKRGLFELPSNPPPIVIWQQTFCDMS